MANQTYSDILTDVLTELHSGEILNDFPRDEDADLNPEETLKSNMLYAMHEAAVAAVKRYEEKTSGRRRQRSDHQIITAGDLTVEIDSSGYPVGDVDLPVKKISVYQCGSDWLVVACHGGDDHFHVYEDIDSYGFFDSKSEAISVARFAFKQTPTAVILDTAMVEDFGREMKVLRRRDNAAAN